MCAWREPVMTTPFNPRTLTSPPEVFTGKGQDYDIKRPLMGQVCDRFEVGWGLIADGHAVVALQPMRGSV